MNLPAKSAIPGERWRATLQPIDSTAEDSPQGTVTLVDFDPRTDSWTVKREGREDTIALRAAQLIARID